MKNIDYTDKRSIAVIGDKDLISGLKIFGFDTFFVKEETIKEIFKEMLEKNYSICLIQETYFSKLKNLVSEIKQRLFPLILPIPDHNQVRGEAKKILKELSIRAIGADILK